MRFWGRKKTSKSEADADDGRQAWRRRTDPAEAITGIRATPESAPDSFVEPKVDPSLERVYDDEVDPAWRDPETE